MADTNMELHSRDQVWKAIGDVSKQQASTEARLTALSTAVEAGFAQLQNTLQNVLTRQTAPFPIWNLVSAVGVLAVVLGGYATLLTQPLYATAQLHYAAIEELQKEEMRVSRLEAQIEELEQYIRDIDRYGSRRWIEDNPK